MVIFIKAEKWTKFNYYKDLNKKVIVPAFKSIGEGRAADHILYCGEMVNQIECTSCGTKHFGGFRTCTNRWCLNCQHKRLVCWMARLLPIFEEWYSQGNYISNLNFTVRDGENLGVTMDFLEESYRNLYNTNSKKRKLWNERFPGGVKSLEVKLGSGSGLWHPHFHCLVMQKAGEYIKDYEWLSEEWHGIVGFKTNETYLLGTGEWVAVADETVRRSGELDFNWNGNLFIKKVSQYKKKGKKMFQDGILGAVCETLKYIIKVDESVDSDTNKIYADHEKFSEAYYTLKNKRQVSTWGLLHNIASEVDKAFEKEDYQQLKDFICQRCGCTEGKLETILYRMIAEDTILYDIPKTKKNNAPR